jgi:hypothetical protein
MPTKSNLRRIVALSLLGIPTSLLLSIKYLLSIACRYFDASLNVPGALLSVPNIERGIFSILLLVNLILRRSSKTIIVV